MTTRRLEDLRRYLHAAYIDLRLFLTGKSEKDLPPLRLRDVGGGDFRRIGEELAALLVRHGLKPEHRVLDIGCGVGRVALPLTRYLTTGTYDGFDIVKRWIRWCRRHITPVQPNFRFEHANVSNSHYNRRGVPASQFRFPYDDASFDFAFATSVFTHLDLDSARNYLREAQRVLRPGGTLLATFFLIDDAVANPALDFKVDHGSYRLLSETDPDWAIAFDLDALADLLPNRTIERGGWRNEGGEQFQDVVVVRNAGVSPAGLAPSRRHGTAARTPPGQPPRTAAFRQAAQERGAVSGRGGCDALVILRCTDHAVELFRDFEPRNIRLVVLTH